VRHAGRICPLGPSSATCGTAVGSQTAGQHRFAAPESYIPKHLAEKILTLKIALEGERKQVTVLFARPQRLNGAARAS
jgi:hypothetical protein